MCGFSIQNPFSFRQTGFYDNLTAVSAYICTVKRCHVENVCENEKF